MIKPYPMIILGSYREGEKKLEYRVLHFGLTVVHQGKKFLGREDCITHLGDDVETAAHPLYPMHEQPL